MTSLVYNTLKRLFRGSLFLLIGVSYAGSPLWTFTPLTPTTLPIPSNGTETVQYQVTNQSNRIHTLAMKAITGVTQNTNGGYCGNPFTLGYHQSCVLNLTVNGSAIPNYFTGGPVVCDQGSSLQCYQPNKPDILNVTKTEATYSVGGTVNGLTGTLILENNGSDSLTLMADGTFTFSTKELSGSSYSVAVQTQPATQTCTVTNGSGTINNSNITSVAVTCSTNSHTVGGNISGLAGGESVVLQNNGGDNLTVSADGSFTFTTSVAQGAAYNVTVLTQPSTQTCTVTNGSGTISTADVTSVTLICSTNAYTVGGMVTGLSTGQSGVLQNNGGDNLTFSANGAFIFTTPVAQGSTYNVMALTQPSTQTCTVRNGNGTMGSSNVTNVLVDCVTNSTTLLTSVSNLALSKKGYTEYGVSGTPSSGLSRTILVTNAGSYATSNLSISYPTWPVGTTASSNCASSLGASSSCTITINPGSTATSDGTNPCTTTGTAPVAQTISISADNASTVSSTAVILGYGCIYQGGYVYALDDTSAASTSVGGKVAGLINASNSNQWTSTSVDISGVESITNGAQNTTDIVANASCTDSPYNCAAYQCRNNFSGGEYTDWYLPAICEMGYDSTTRGSGCGTVGSSTLQNMQANLVDNGILGALSGRHWSSTQDSDTAVWRQIFMSDGSSSQGLGNKENFLGVRCSRVLVY